MKSIIKIHQISNAKDVANIQRIISKFEGIFACEVSKEKSEVQVIYNEKIIELDKIVEGIENYGYIVI